MATRCVIRDAYFGDIKNDKVDSNLMPLVKKLIDERMKPWDPKMVDDPVQDRLLEIIAAKKKGKKRPAKAKESTLGASKQCRQHHGCFKEKYRQRKQIEKTLTVPFCLGLFNGSGGCAKIGPGIAFYRGKTGRRVEDREIGRADAGSEFLPFEWH